MISYPKKTSILITIGIGIIIIGSWAVFFRETNQSKIGTTQENIQEVVFLIINYGEGVPSTFEVEFKEGMTAFDLLKNKTEDSNIFLKTKKYDVGIFIETIGDRENGENGKYWMYYINDEMPMVAADKQELNPDDKTEFKFEKSSF